MIDRNLDHDRALYAYKCVEEIKEIGDKTEKKYKSAVRSSGALIQKSGLMQTLAFYLSKKSDDEGSLTHYEQLAGHILYWKHICGKTEGSLIDAYKNLLDCPDADEQIIYTTQEAKALILWLKRFAEAMLKGED
ncbi:MAG: type III-B CRISPR module-associated protein Cmr5 [Methanosarcinales archaeon]|uniref:CRISPR type III-B/RAMP module-associated protein Cmr5 n=1 Tax=Candidatus Ethanoperedens thermophilum TaxID=2766897 RepID=A0A848DBC7_9EURY|nr:type III-B CRISPR module-associated protein Cmr5 [Candidatus Ethanoperedens thermophilum]